MLKIIMGEEHVEEFIDIDNYMGYAPATFKEDKNQDWFKSDFAHRVLKSIDHVVMDGRMAVYNEEEDVGYSVDDLSGGTQALLTVYNARDDRVFLVCMGDNCNDFLEEVVLDYEKEGKDLLTVCNYLNKFNFKYIKEIHYLNWDIKAHSKMDILDKVTPLWEEDQALDWRTLEREFYTDHGEEEPWLMRDGV